MEVLAIDHLNLKKENADILNNVVLNLRQGEVHAVIGPNGAGKTSLAYVIMGLEGYRPFSGRVLFGGQDITDWSITKRAREGLTLAWQEPARFEGISVRQFLEISEKNSRKGNGDGPQSPAMRPAEALERVALSPGKYLERKVDRALSGGERKRVELASILLMRPRVVILDEPDSGIDTAAMENIFEIIAGFKTLEIAALLITHSDSVLKVADRASLLCSGHIVKTGLPEEAADYYTKYCVTCPDESYAERGGKNE